MNLIPLFDNVVLEINDTHDSNIIIPSSAQEKPLTAQVIACGQGDQDHPMSIKVNDIVLYNKFAGYEFHFQKRTYILIKQTDILAIVKE